MLERKDRDALVGKPPQEPSKEAHPGRIDPVRALVQHHQLGMRTKHAAIPSR
jgi:hypothetical protein